MHSGAILQLCICYVYYNIFIYCLYVNTFFIIIINVYIHNMYYNVCTHHCKTSYYYVTSV